MFVPVPSVPTASGAHHLIPRNSDLETYSLTQVKAIHILEVTSSVLSVIVGTIAITLWFRMDPSRRVIFRLELLLGLIVSDYLKALFVLCFAAYNLTQLNKMSLDNKYFNNYLFTERFCDGWGFLKETATICADLSIMTLTGHNALMIFKPQLSKIHAKTPMNFTKMCTKFIRYLKGQEKCSLKDVFFKKDQKDIIYVNEGGVYPLRWYIMFVIISIATICSALIFVNHGHYEYNFSCASPRNPIWKRLLAGWIIRYINLISIVCVYSVIIIYLKTYSRSIEKGKKLLYRGGVKSNNLSTTTTTTTNNPATKLTNVRNTLQKELMDLTAETNSKRHNAITRELKSFAIYPIGYWIIWTTPTISQIYDYLNVTEPFVLLVFVAFTMPLSCTIDTIIFLVREKPWNATSSKLAQRNTLQSPFRAQTWQGSQVDLNQLDHQLDHHQLGLDSELVLYHPDSNTNKDADKRNPHSMASSTLIGSKRPSTITGMPPKNIPPISNISNIAHQDTDQSNNLRKGSATSSDETATTFGEEREEDSSVDMIDFLRGFR